MNWILNQRILAENFSLLLCRLILVITSGQSQTTASYSFLSKSGVCDWSCSCLSCSVEILKCLGLVKHPQYMSCIYITLFLVTMLIISLQVNDSFLFAELF